MQSFQRIRLSVKVTLNITKCLILSYSYEQVMYRQDRLQTVAIKNPTFSYQVSFLLLQDNCLMFKLVICYFGFVSGCRLQYKRPMLYTIILYLQTVFQQLPFVLLTWESQMNCTILKMHCSRLFKAHTPCLSTDVYIPVLLPSQRLL